VVSEGRPILTNNAQEDPRFNSSESIANYHLRSILCVPLNVKQKNIGVIYADNRIQSGAFSERDEALLSSLADQAAIAIENATLFEKVQRNAQEISEAYDATIQGWARALEFRDYETQGHCQRVTELTLQLAIASKVPEEELIHIKRGAILHDVGKMGISDHILLKPGPLTEEEWKIIRLHPEYGYEFLKQIPFLKQALPIVRYHHEHWDGTGYPKGLKGEQIPFPARIFSIADVWDALVHARPYKRPWSKDEALFYMNLKLANFLTLRLFKHS
jgi:HD-GYP domain-containing protein (c-di-GMP phosphodiesterase class II)